MSLGHATVNGGPNRLLARLTGLQWRLIEDGAASGSWNMAVDEALLEAARRDEIPPTLRLYGWSRPTLSLGRHQDPAAGIDHAYRQSRAIDLVRRPTGGRAVLHDREVTYSIALPAALARAAGVGDVYSILSGALLAGLTEMLREMGVQAFRPGARTAAEYPRSGRSVQVELPVRPNARTPERLNAASCFATAAGGDGLGPGGKLVGSAQARRAGAVLQHGSVLLAVRRDDWQGLFGGPGLEVALDRLVSPPPEDETVRQALRRGLEQRLDARWKPGTLAERERGEAERLLDERYSVGCLD